MSQSTDEMTQKSHDEAAPSVARAHCLPGSAGTAAAAGMDVSICFTDPGALLALGGFGAPGRLCLRRKNADGNFVSMLMSYQPEHWKLASIVARIPATTPGDPVPESPHWYEEFPKYDIIISPGVISNDCPTTPAATDILTAELLISGLAGGGYPRPPMGP